MMIFRLSLDFFKHFLFNFDYTASSKNFKRVLKGADVGVLWSFFEIFTKTPIWQKFQILVSSIKRPISLVFSFEILL